MRRKPGTLMPIEVAILQAGARLVARREAFHGFAIAKAIADDRDASLLTAHGTLYKALRRMEEAGLLASEWEDAEVALEAGRPRRRLYRVTPRGSAALARHLSAEAADPVGDPATTLGPSPAH